MKNDLVLHKRGGAIYNAFLLMTDLFIPFFLFLFDLYLFFVVTFIVILADILYINFFFKIQKKNSAFLKRLFFILSGFFLLVFSKIIFLFTNVDSQKIDLYFVYAFMAMYVLGVVIFASFASDNPEVFLKESTGDGASSPK